MRPAVVQWGLVQKQVLHAKGTRCHAVVRWASSRPVVIAPQQASGYRLGMKKPNFWDVDLTELFKLWISDISTFLMTLLMFMALSLPVVIPGLILWFLWSINWRPG